MKKTILLFLILLLFTSPLTACEIVCPIKSQTSADKENIFLNISGIDFLSKKIIETLIQKELKEELNSDIKADLDIFNLKSLKQGEFKTLELTSKNIKYRALSLSDFKAKTACEYNKIAYINNKIKYTYAIPFKFNASITNEDIQNIINSEEFQKELKRNEKDLFQIKTPSIEIQEGQIRFTIPVKTLIGTIKIKHKTSLKVENNKLALTNTTIKTKSNIINDSMLNELIDLYNPMKYITSAINGKYYQIYIENAQTEADRINIEGIFTINKNYGEGNE